MCARAVCLYLTNGTVDLRLRYTPMPELCRRCSTVIASVVQLDDESEQPPDHDARQVMILAMNEPNQEFPGPELRGSACREFLTRRFELVPSPSRSLGLHVHRCRRAEPSTALFVVRLPFCPITRSLRRFSQTRLDLAALRQSLSE